MMTVTVSVTIALSGILCNTETMNETLMYAKYNQAGNKTVYDILSGMSNGEREKDRGSYYGSLPG